MKPKGEFGNLPFSERKSRLIAFCFYETTKYVAVQQPAESRHETSQKRGGAERMETQRDMGNIVPN